MNRLTKGFALGAAAFSASGLAAQEISESTSELKPNIILFLVDDMGWQDTSVNFAEMRTKLNDRYSTPNMEYLAENGVVFTNAHAHAISSPTRTSIMTGQNPARHRVTNWTLYKDRSQDTNYPLYKMPEWNKDGLQPEDGMTLAQGLQQSGYKTIHCGKAHWGAINTPGEDPRNLGFDVNIAGHAAGGPGSYYGLENFGNNPDGSRKRPWGIPGLSAYHGKDVYLNDALTIEANKAVDQAVAENRPFYLYMAHYAIHAPIMADKSRLQKYLDASLDYKEASYATMIESMDASLGSIIDNLKEEGVAENTVIIFASDNGGLTIAARGQSPYGGESHNYPLREGKGSAYEGGTRTPFIVSPAVRTANNFSYIGKNKRTNVPMVSEDLFSTVLTLGGFKDWDKIPQVYDGINILVAFSGTYSNGELADRPLFFHVPNQWTSNRGKNCGYQPHSSIEKNGWKAIYFYRAKRWELYNLNEDIGEQNDLSSSDTGKLKELKAELVNFLKNADAQVPVTKVLEKPLQIK